MKKPSLLLAGILLVLFCLQASGEKQPEQMSTPRLPMGASPASPRVDDDFGKIPLQFIPNQGQMDGRVAYYVQGRDKTIYFTSEGLTFVLAEQTQKDGKKQPEPVDSNGPDAAQRWVVKLDFVDSNADAKPVGLEKSGAVVSYFKGKPEEWKAGLTPYSKIIYRELWPGIDLLYYGTFNRMKYEFIVHPEADPSLIRLAYRGAEMVALTAEGRLEVKTPAGDFEDDTPVAYQGAEGERLNVHIAYDLNDYVETTVPAAASGPKSVPDTGQVILTRTYGFEVGEYDQSQTLVIDPVVIVYSGFIGGASWDAARGIAVDDSGCAYIVGDAFSTQTTFPDLIGPDLSYNGGTDDAFIAKVNASGTALIYCGYIGGAGDEVARSVYVDSSGNAYVTGYSTSRENTFPVNIGPDLTYNDAGVLGDAFVAKVDPSGSSLIYCGYIGGSGADTGTGIVANEAGTAFISGHTDSTESTFPVKAGPDLTYNGGTDAFIAKVNSSGTNLIYCGYIGGDGSEAGQGITIDTSGNAYLAGNTGSSQSTFPVKVGPVLTYAGGSGDGFIAKVNPTGTGLDYCGYLGGTDFDCATGVAVDSLGNAYIAGYISAASLGFPVTVGPGLIPGGGYYDSYVAKLNPAGTAFVYCGYICGSGPDLAYGIDIDAFGAAYVFGYTRSNESTFPVKDGPDLTYNGDYTQYADAFVAKVTPSGTSLDYCGYIGGSSDDYGYCIAVDKTGAAYVAGQTQSTQSTFPVNVGPDLSHNGNGDAFVVKIQVLGVPPTIASISPSSASAGDPGFTLTVTGTYFVEGAIVVWDGADRPTTFVSSSEVNATIGADGLAEGKTVHVTVRNPDGQSTSALEFIISVATPSLTTLVPSSAHAGDPQLTLVVNGSSFVDGAIVMWEGADRPSTFIGSAQLNAIIWASDLTTAKTVQVTVRNPGSGSSNALEFTVDDPVPILTSLVPSMALAGSQGFTVSVIGSKFLNGATVRWDGSDRPTTFVNSNEVDATVGAADIASAKSVDVTVRNPDGRTSSGLTFTINNPPPPTLTALSPTRISAGGAGFNLTLSGTNFVTNSVVKWNGNNKATTYISSAELRAAILAGDIAAGGEVQVTVVNPIPAGNTSNAIAFPVSSFTLNASPTSATVTAGQSAAYAIQVTPNISSFDSSVSFKCTGLPSNSTASISPPTVIPGSNVVATALTITTKASSSSAAGAILINGNAVPVSLWFLFAILIYLGWFCIRKTLPRKFSRRWLTAGALICVIALIGSCGAGGGDPPPNNGTPSGTYQVTVQGESGSLTASTMVTLIVR